MSDFFTALPGETPAPLPDGPALCGATDAMRRVHRVFLWAYSEAPGLARSAAAGDTVRSAYVAGVLRNFDKILHIHHEGEDVLMYPKLRARSPACALHIDQMLAHHAEVAALLDELAPVRDQWGATADPVLGETLAQHYERLDEVLKVHLRREVTEVTPAVDRLLTEKEVMALAKHGTDAFEVKVMLGYLGMVFATNPPGEREEFAKDIPFAVRLAYKVVGRRLYRKQYATLFPGREIPATL